MCEVLPALKSLSHNHTVVNENFALSIMPMLLLLLANATTRRPGGGETVLTHYTLARMHYRSGEQGDLGWCEYQCVRENKVDEITWEGLCDDRKEAGRDKPARLCVCEDEEQCNRVACSKDGLDRSGVDRREAGGTSVILALFGIAMLG